MSGGQTDGGRNGANAPLDPERKRRDRRMLLLGATLGLAFFALLVWI
jgi:hypothetical protein